MKKRLIAAVRLLLNRAGFDIVRNHNVHHQAYDYPADFSRQNIEICEKVKPYTLTSMERVNALIEAVRYLEKSRISGALVECGVWKGGSAMAMMLTLKQMGSNSRELYLYDTFSGMSEPIEVDISSSGDKAREKFSQLKTSDDRSDWCYAPIDEVKENTLSTGYPGERIHFVQGKVEDTIPKQLPNEIALLRLDTDWYESTRHELIHLFPLLKEGGVLIIDDYGHWEGARKAVDEYFSGKNISLLLNRIDYTARIAIKT